MKALMEKLYGNVGGKIKSLACWFFVVNSAAALFAPCP